MERRIFGRPKRDESATQAMTYPPERAVRTAKTFFLVRLRRSDRTTGKGQRRTAGS
jgi:hypothetical protein